MCGRRASGAASCWRPSFPNLPFPVASQLLNLLGIGRGRVPSPHDLLHNLLYQFCELAEPCFDIAAEVHAQCAALAFGKNLEISASLCRLDHAKGVFLSGDGQVLSVVASNLEKYSAVGSTFIRLSSRVQESWTEAKDGRHALTIAHVHSQTVHQSFVFGIHLDVTKQSEIVAGTETREVGAQVVLERSVGRRVCTRGLREFGGIDFVGEEFKTLFFNNRFFGRKRAFAFVLRGEFLGYDLARLDVRLIKSIDSDNRACDGSRNLPAEEFLPQAISIGHRDSNYRLPGFFQRGDLGILCGVWRGLQTEIGEDAVVSVDLWRTRRFAVNRNDAFALLACRFREQLFKPRTEIRNSGRSDERNFVAAKFCRRAED